MAGQTCDGTVVGQAPIKSRPLAAPLVDAPVRGQILGKATYTCQAVHGSHGRERDPYILTGSSKNRPFRRFIFDLVRLHGRLAHIGWEFLTGLLHEVLHRNA